jgi:hypothetical protein
MRADHGSAVPVTQLKEGRLVRLRVFALRVGVLVTLLLASALGGGWKWDRLPV